MDAERRLGEVVSLGELPDPMFKLRADPRVFVYAAGGYYYPGKDLSALRGEMRGYLDRGYNVVKMKIGGAPLQKTRPITPAMWGVPASNL